MKSYTIPITKDVQYSTTSSKKTYYSVEYNKKYCTVVQQLNLLEGNYKDHVNKKFTNLTQEAIEKVLTYNHLTMSTPCLHCIVNEFADTVPA